MSALNNSYAVEKWLRENQYKAKKLGEVIYKNRFKSGKKIREAVFKSGAGPEEEQIVAWATENKNVAQRVFLKLYKELFSGGKND